MAPRRYNTSPIFWEQTDSDRKRIVLPALRTLVAIPFNSSVSSHLLETSMRVGVWEGWKIPHAHAPTPRNAQTRTMEPLNLPSYEFRTTDQNGKRQIYDSVRQTYVRLTPEEWVRQHFVQYLIQELDVPAGLVATEATFRYQDQPWRADVVVHDRQGTPLLLVECKAPSVPIRQDAFDQGARYNLVLGAPYLVVTNGQEHYACRVDPASGGYAFLDDLPTYDDLLDQSSP